MSDIRARLTEMRNASNLLTKIYDEVITTRETVKSIIDTDALSSVWEGTSCDSFVQGAVEKVMGQFEEMLLNVTNSNKAMQAIIETYAATESENETKLNSTAEGFTTPTYDTI